MAGRRKFKGEKREAYLEGLRRTGNNNAAAREAGICVSTGPRCRKREPEFEALCLEAVAEAQRRLAGAEGPFDGCDEAAFESIRRGADGRRKIQALGNRRWSKLREERFFAMLRECGNVAASARAAEVSREAVWKRRREWPSFARRFEETMDEAEIALEYRIACLGTNWTEDSEQADFGHAADAGAAAGAAAFDPELALRFLKWREEKKRRLRAPTAALPSAEEARERIARGVAALRRYNEREAARRAAEDEA